MATFSSHLLDATNGSHAANVEVIIYQINENGKKKEDGAYKGGLKNGEWSTWYKSGKKKDTGFYIPIQFKDKKENLFGNNDLEEVIRILKPFLEDENIPKTGQNIKYDALILKRFGIELQGIEFDTMIAAHLLNPNARSYKLDNLSLSHLNYKMVPIKDLIGSGKNQITMDQVTLDDISFYAAEDADVVIELTEIFMRDLKKQKLFNYFDPLPCFGIGKAPRKIFPHKQSISLHYF